jgi:hypothetical protein
MSKSSTALSAMVALTLSYPAAAAELAPLQAGTFRLGIHIASVFYTAQGEHYDVVTTIAPEQGGAPMRFVASLEAGQSQSVSVGKFGAAAAPRALKLAHEGDRLVVTIDDMQVASR